MTEDEAERAAQFMFRVLRSWTRGLDAYVECAVSLTDGRFYLDELPAPFRAAVEREAHGIIQWAKDE